MINKDVLQTGVTLMFVCKLHLDVEILVRVRLKLGHLRNTLHNRRQSLGVFEFLSTKFGNPHNHFFICSRITNVHFG